MQVIRIKLEININVQQALASNDSNLATELQNFTGHLLKTGEGKSLIATFPGNNPSIFVSLHKAMHLKSNNLLDLLKRGLSRYQQ